ncbi:MULTISPECIES: carboxylesterase family protein [Pandoraea]|uniref:Carboxylic ester hydrolase n=1 Tax=Pandoraea capi TaxID=2508286 RepID=A0ABY6VU36_9BURK|nr:MULTISPECIES: carboxylesterase family protein [Pandoraea]MCI3208295.1 hypothetical protein [Pandoraea sp. LA3]MDN4586324.1 hypothetical protein [Pandoraea capi]VVD84304.1 Para-nitrobenzyl esterase [Pandoraea capi]
MTSQLPNPPRAICDSGELAGATHHGVDAFFDIPYGTAQRFALPSAPQRWQGVRDATRPGPVFPQAPSRLSAVMGDTQGFSHQSEDAFTLNVWTPTSRTGANNALPVLVWIHGGGWLTGGAPLDWYHGDALARSARAVVVSVNYRLGALGNLYLPGQTPGSMALHDLIAALQWVGRNIGAFGGDASRITVCGQSAGAWYTAALASSPLSRDLFSQAILLSLPGSIAPQTPDDAESLGRQFCAMLNVPADLGTLRQLPTAALLDAQAGLARTNPVFADIPPTFLPTISDALPEDLIGTLAARGPALRLLIGTLPDEMGAFFSHDNRVKEANDADTLARYQACFGHHGAQRLALRRRRAPELRNYDHLNRAVSDAIFREPTQRLARGLSSAGGDCFVYEFRYASAMPDVGACHCFELPFLFGTFPAWAQAPMFSGLHLPQAMSVAADFQAAVLRFTETGDPNGDRLPSWPRYNGKAPIAMKFDQAPSTGTFTVDD